MVPLFTWTGVYIGGNIGAGWVQGDVVSDADPTFVWKRSNAQFLGGGQIGFNYQWGAFVFGAELDGDWTSGKKSSPFIFVDPNDPDFGVKVDGEWNWLVTAAARLGFAWDRTLFYAKLGYGWSRTSANLVDTNGATLGCCGTGNTNSGFLAGGGIEYALTNNWTIKGEYDFLWLKSRSATVTALNGVVPIDLGTVTWNPNIQMFKVGFNYKFGGY